MKFCNKCGQELKVDTVFCSKCGNKLEPTQKLNDILNEENIKATKITFRKATKRERFIITLLVILLLVTLLVYVNKNKSNEQTHIGNNAVSTEPVVTSQPKYNIKNLSKIIFEEKDFEQLYEKAKNSAFSWIDSLEEEDYLPANKCSVTIFDDNSAAFILKTVDKSGIDDNSVLVTLKYLLNERKWQRLEIVYNKKQYGQ